LFEVEARDSFSWFAANSCDFLLLSTSSTLMATSAIKLDPASGFSRIVGNPLESRLALLLLLAALENFSRHSMSSLKLSSVI
jgi:hypothetical protein